MLEILRQETAGIAHLLTAKDVASILRVSPKRVYELPIPQVRFGRSIRFRPVDVTAYVESHCERAA